MRYPPGTMAPSVGEIAERHDLEDGRRRGCGSWLAGVGVRVGAGVAVLVGVAVRHGEPS